MGRHTRIKHAALPAQILQPLHLQLLCLCCCLPESAGLSRFCALEHVKRGGSHPLERAVGGWHVSLQIILPLHRSACRGDLDGRLAVPDWNGSIFFSPDRVVHCLDLLH